jgi:hypothetical protein
MSIDSHCHLEALFIEEGGKTAKDLQSIRAKATETALRDSRTRSQTAILSIIILGSNSTLMIASRNAHATPSASPLCLLLAVRERT